MGLSGTRILAVAGLGFSLLAAAAHAQQENAPERSSVQSEFSPVTPVSSGASVASLNQGSPAQLPGDGVLGQSPSSDIAPAIMLTPANSSVRLAGGPGAIDGDAPQEGRQTKRILYIIPNFRAVSTDSFLPPQPVKEKLITATEDSLDYSSFIFVGIQAGAGMAGNSYPEFRQGALGYSRYYWHTFADATDENLWVEFLLPTVLRQDTRYYTMGKGGIVKRFAYSVSRLVITRNDNGHETFNSSEIIGAGVAAGLSNFYYPAQERTEVKSYQRWVTNVSLDGAVFIFKEFWPDINNSFFHQKD